MKSFFQFLSESAAQQAARLGLEGDGHGGWYDRSTKEFVAKTEKGRLKFYNKRQEVGKGDPDQTELEKIEGIELLRSLENLQKIGTFELKSEACAVDVKKDINQVKKFLEIDNIRKFY